MEVLKGASETIKRFQPILIVEFSEIRENVHESGAQLVEIIKTFGNYRFYKLKGGKERKSKLVEILNNDQLPQHDNVICMSKIHNS